MILKFIKLKLKNFKNKFKTRVKLIHIKVDIKKEMMISHHLSAYS